MVLDSRHYVIALIVALATALILLIAGAAYHIDLFGRIAVLIEVVIICSIIVFFAIVGTKTLNDEEKEGE